MAKNRDFLHLSTAPTFLIIVNNLAHHPDEEALVGGRTPEKWKIFFNRSKNEFEAVVMSCAEVV